MSKVKQLTEVQMWRQLARQWSNAARRTVGGRNTPTVNYSIGVCACIVYASIDDIISSSVRDAMQLRMKLHKPSDAGVCWWPLTSTGARSRAKFCTKMAQLAEAEPKTKPKPRTRKAVK